MMGNAYVSKGGPILNRSDHLRQEHGAIGERWRIRSWPTANRSHLSEISRLERGLRDKASTKQTT